MVYRYQPRPGVPIDAGEWCQVMENKGFIATIYSTSFGSCIWVSQMHHCATKLPDVILLDTAKDWLFLIEAVTSHGPMSPKRIHELEEMLIKCKS
jgi:hypothetical protein